MGWPNDNDYISFAGKKQKHKNSFAYNLFEFISVCLRLTIPGKINLQQEPGKLQSPPFGLSIDFEKLDHQNVYKFFHHEVCMSKNLGFPTMRVLNTSGKERLNHVANNA